VALMRLSPRRGRSRGWAVAMPVPSPTPLRQSQSQSPPQQSADRSGFDACGPRFLFPPLLTGPLRQWPWRVYGWWGRWPWAMGPQSFWLGFGGWFWWGSFSSGAAARRLWARNRWWWCAEPSRAGLNCFRTGRRPGLLSPSALGRRDQLELEEKVAFPPRSLVCHCCLVVCVLCASCFRENGPGSVTLPAKAKHGRRSLLRPPLKEKNCRNRENTGI
jgi:hypothetical protein